MAIPSTSASARKGSWRRKRCDHLHGDQVEPRREGTAVWFGVPNTGGLGMSLRSGRTGRRCNASNAPDTGSVWLRTRVPSASWASGCQGVGGLLQHPGNESSLKVRFGLEIACKQRVFQFNHHWLSVRRRACKTVRMDNGSERTLADLGPELALVDPCLPSRRGVASGRGRAANAGGANLVPRGRRTRALAPLEPPPVAIEPADSPLHWRRMLGLAVLIFVGAGGCTSACRSWRTRPRRSAARIPSRGSAPRA
jgi:hypothetical protein